MSFQDSFAQLMSKGGVPVDAAVVPTREALEADLDALASWLFGLEKDTRIAIDEVTAGNTVQAGLADPEVAVVAMIGGVLAAFDAAPASIPVSMSLETMRTAALQATD